jgi:hypothetical protein
MPSSGIFVKGLLAATLIFACMVLGNYWLLTRDVSTDAHGDTYVYEAAGRPTKIDTAKPLQVVQVGSSQSLNGVEGERETVRLSFSAHLQTKTLKESTQVSVFLVKEIGVPPAARVMLFVRPQEDGSTGVVSTLSKAGESGKAAALRALAAHAGVNPVPDLDFLTPVGTASGEHVVYVAYIRQERLHLKGRQQPADGKWVAFKDIKLADALQEATVGLQSLAAQCPTDALLQAMARAYLNPWFKTAGLPPGSCG